MEFEWIKEYGAWVAATVVGAWGTWQKTQRHNAQTRAVVAESATIAEIAKAQGLVYTQLRAELNHMHAEISGLKSELATERAHSLRQDRYIHLLVRLLRDNNINPPPFESREDSNDRG